MAFYPGGFDLKTNTRKERKNPHHLAEFYSEFFNLKSGSFEVSGRIEDFIIFRDFINEAWAEHLPKWTKRQESNKLRLEGQKKAQERKEIQDRINNLKIEKAQIEIALNTDISLKSRQKEINKELETLQEVPETVKKESDSDELFGKS